MLLREANVSLTEDEQQQRLNQFVDDVFSVEMQLAQVQTSFILLGRLRQESSAMDELPAMVTKFSWKTPGPRKWLLIGREPQKKSWV